MRRGLTVFLCTLLLAFILPIAAAAAAPPAHASGMLRILQTSGSTAPSHQVALTWAASVDAATIALTYTVLRAAGACGATGQTFAAVQSAIAGTTATDATVIVGNEYSYEVEAVSSSGVSSLPSNCVDVLLRPTPPTLQSATGS